MLRDSPLGGLSNRANVLPREFCAAIVLSVGGPVATLLAHVKRVVSICAEEEMVGVDTRAVVAVMAHEQSSGIAWKVGYRSVEQLPGKTMSHIGARAVEERSVTLGCFASDPLPARVGFLDETPKSYLRSDRFIHGDIVAEGSHE